MIKTKTATVEIIDVPPEFNGAVTIAWKRVRQLSWGMPLFMLDAMKPMLTSIYMQGFSDGDRAAAIRKGDSGKAD